MNALELYGATERFENEATMYPDLKLGRVIAQYRGRYKIATSVGEAYAEISGKMRYDIQELAQYPVVGDYVMYKPPLQEQGDLIIEHILTRKSIFLRKAVGMIGQAQAVASNIDIVFICMSLNQNYNLNRLERYLAVAWDSGAKPVIVLTKTDLCNNLHDIIEEVAEDSLYTDIITVSMYDTKIMEKFNPYLTNKITAAMIGSSGVGKSTLINLLLGTEILDTNEVGKLDKGRHTTTRKEMFPMPFGGVLIDTPGMRELGIENVNLEKTFDDIEELASTCRFRDCTHTSEPGCAILKAIQDGAIDQRRVESYLKLKHEADYEGLSAKERENRKLERMFKEVGGMKKVRRITRESNKRK